jgi:alpha-L-fucosidase
LPDFDTPEYATFASIQERKWESSEGMDPHSYGYNAFVFCDTHGSCPDYTHRETSAEKYKNATTLIHNLVDIVSKNGN